MVPAGLRPLILAATLAASAAAAQAQPAWRTGEEAMADRAAGVTRFNAVQIRQSTVAPNEATQIRKENP